MLANFISIVFLYRELNVKTVLFQTIRFSISRVFCLYMGQIELNGALMLNWVVWNRTVKCQTVLFQTIHFSISVQFSSFWPIDRTLSGATNPGQSGPRSDGTEMVLCILKSSSITGSSPLDCLVSYPGHLLGESYPSAEMQSVYSTSRADWAINR